MKQAQITMYMLVPIYDRQALPNMLLFMFSDADFRNLARQPLCKNSMEELPLHSVVSIGYMLAIYPGVNSCGLSSNIQFVIVLAVLGEA